MLWPWFFFWYLWHHRLGKDHKLEISRRINCQRTGVWEGKKSTQEMCPCKGRSQAGHLEMLWLSEGQAQRPRESIPFCWVLGIFMLQEWFGRMGEAVGYHRIKRFFLTFTWRLKETKYFSVRWSSLFQLYLLSLWQNQLRGGKVSFCFIVSAISFIMEERGGKGHSNRRSTRGCWHYSDRQEAEHTKIEPGVAITFKDHS